MTGVAAAGPPPALLDLLERVLGSLLRLDPEALGRLKGMAGKTIAVELAGLGQTIYLSPEAAAIRLRGDHRGEVHVRIRGTPLALLAMSADTEGASVASGVEIIGDVALGRHLQSLLASFSVDWEELLSHYIGDVAAHQLGRGGRAAGRWLAETRTTLERDSAEYLRNEAELLPERWQVLRFLADVDDLRTDLDRLEARIKRLRGRLGRAAEEGPA
ncbi:MAG: ubiquinone biosynthesis accessory factor UbiJ [Gammaproteobacteria bacterium]